MKVRRSRVGGHGGLHKSLRGDNIVTMSDKSSARHCDASVGLLGYASSQNAPRRNEPMLRADVTPASLHARQADTLPGKFGLVVTRLEEQRLDAEVAIQPWMLAPNGYLHAASVLLLADTACGYACMAHLPEGAKNFTTIELKSNFLGTAREGTMRTECRAEHLGRTTQVWSATVFGPERSQARAVPLHPDDPVVNRAAPPPRRGAASPPPRPAARAAVRPGSADAAGLARRRAGAARAARRLRARRLSLRRAGAAGARPAGALARPCDRRRRPGAAAAATTRRRCRRW